MCKFLSRYIRLTKMTTHSCKRFWEYSQDIPEIAKINWTVKRMRKLIGKKICKEIKSGLVLDKTGAFHIPINWGLFAAVVLSSNGYLVITVHKNERGIDLEELREQHK